MLRISSLLISLWLLSVRASADRPNILYIMSDDHAAHAISAYGSRLAAIAPTPNIDRLANEGALFTNAFCTNSICSPSRACVLTGQYNHVNGAFDLSGEVRPGRQMLALQMRQAGYQTAMIGKWHLKAEPADFDYYCVLPGQGKYHDPEFLVRGDKPWGRNRLHFDGQHSTDAITDLTIDWLKTGREKDKPFFLMHDYQDKRWMYEESQRMPFLVRYPPTVAAGQRFDTLIENVDYGPTMLDFAEADIPPSVQGKSFRSLLETGQEPSDWKQEVYYRYWMHMAHHDNPGHLGIRTKTHKLIYYYGCNYDGGYQTPPGWELYDLVNDPQETQNLADNSAHAVLLAELKSRLAETRQRVGDDGTHYPKCEAIVQEFWDYDEADQAKAREISHRFRQRREQELKAGQRNVRTWIAN